EGERVGGDGPAGQRLQGEGGDELLSGGGHHHLDARPGLRQEPDDVARLVARDATGHPEQEAASIEAHRGPSAAVAAAVSDARTRGPGERSSRARKTPPSPTWSSIWTTQVSSETPPA